MCITVFNRFNHFQYFSILIQLQQTSSSFLILHYTNINYSNQILLRILKTLKTLKIPLFTYFNYFPMFPLFHWISIKTVILLFCFFVFDTHRCCYNCLLFRPNLAVSFVCWFLFYFINMSKSLFFLFLLFLKNEVVEFRVVRLRGLCRPVNIVRFCCGRNVLLFLVWGWLWFLKIWQIKIIVGFNLNF